MKDALPRVSIGIVTCSGSALLGPCLESLAGLDYPEECIEILIHDNGSSAPVAPWAQQRFPRAEVWSVPANQGFAGPCNGLVERARTDLVCLVNDDMTFDAGFLRSLVGTQQAPQRPAWVRASWRPRASSLNSPAGRWLSPVTPPLGVTVFRSRLSRIARRWKRPFLPRVERCWWTVGNFSPRAASIRPILPTTKMSIWAGVSTLWANRLSGRARRAAFIADMRAKRFWVRPGE